MLNSSAVENHIYRPVCLPPQTVKALRSLGKKNACDLFTMVNRYPTEEVLKNIYEMTFETNKNIAFIYSQLFPIMLAGKEGIFLPPIVELWPRLLRRDQGNENSG